jgi:septal ring factor EnvC (AmiA/AmiB activator)
VVVVRLYVVVCVIEHSETLKSPQNTLSELSETLKSPQNTLSELSETLKSSQNILSELSETLKLPQNTISELSGGFISTKKEKNNENPKAGHTQLA